MTRFIPIALLVGWAHPALSQVMDCPNADTHPMPVLSERVSTIYTQKLEEAQLTLSKQPEDVNALIWYGRRLAYTGRYYGAIEVFTKAINSHPTDARAYRHRGHRWLTLRCFDKALADFHQADRLTRGKPDETEPDGLPNERNIPTSTLQSNIWYHAGLVHFLTRDYSEALRAYKKCLRVSNNPDMYVATANWLYITLLKLGKKQDAARLLSNIKLDMDLLENQDYHKILMLYKQSTTIADPLAYLEQSKELSLASFGFGFGNYLLERGQCEAARQVFERITQSDQWAAFGFIAADKALRDIPCRGK